jgi:hypothetical protein
MSSRSEMMSRIAKRVKRCADQIETMNLKTRLHVMNDILQHQLDSEKEIDKLVTGKYAGLNHSENLKNVYETSTEVIRSSQRALFVLNQAVQNNDENLLDIKRDFLKVKDSVIKSIKQLDNYYFGITIP